MNLYFLRHAHAEDGSGLPDEMRALSKTGREQAAATADLFRRLQLDVKALYHSPRLRCKQTADAVSSVLNVTPQERAELDIGFSALRLNEMLRDSKAGDTVLLIGHEPTFSQVIRELTGGRVEMKKCGLARVDIMTRRPLQGDLVWLLPPRLVHGLLEDQ